MESLARGRVTNAIDGGGGNLCPVHGRYLGSVCPTCNVIGSASAAETARRGTNIAEGFAGLPYHLQATTNSTTASATTTTSSSVWS